MTSRLLNILSTTITRSLIPGILLLSVAACKNDPKEIHALMSKGEAQEDKAFDVTILYSENGKTKARLFTREFVRNEVAKPPYVDMKKKLFVEFFDDSMKVNNTLSAKYARYYEQQENVLIRDSVVVVNKKGEELNTEELVWNQKLRKFYTEKFVRITTPTQVMYGDGLEANEDFSWYEIKHPKGIVQVDKESVPQ